MSSVDRVTATLARWPATWFAIGLVGALEVGFWLAFRPGPLMLGASLALAMVLLALWPVFAVRAPEFLARHQALGDASTRETRERLVALERDLAELDADRGLDQLRMVRQKLDTLTAVLQRRMNAGELAFGRYVGTAEQVYLATLDNLHEIVVVLTSAKGIDRDYIDDRLASLGSSERDGEGERRERDSLAERHELLERQLAKVSELYAQNESAMTALDNTAMALADTRTSSGRAAVDAEGAMAALEELAKRTRKYAASG